METSARQRLYDAAARCSVDPHWADTDRPIEAATRALVDGLDSPALRELAGMPRSSRPGPLRQLLLDALDELDVPQPDPTSPGQRVSGTSYARLPTDRLSLHITPNDEGFEVLIHVNELEITQVGAGMGMHPFDLFVPANQLVATTEPRRVIVARCECGESGCGSTEARITRDDGVVHWDWSVDVPLGHGVSFEAEAYDAEVERIGVDNSWQRPADTASRLVLEGADRNHLAAAGLTLNWAAQDHRDPQRFLVALVAKAEMFQVFLRFPMKEPERLAAEVLQTLRQPPGKWRATFHSMVVGRRARPSMASRRWRSEDPWG
ncbi:hypothetical protein [Kribbella sindirgiensis]|uniref:Uncharacterized protein n=1 Tax=Kribbella sindirgiensis TaxID=1124744 RepID=A0A4R0JMU8_9ACTN|nr:hypothetical protein [Kribbella sindirgiensis]TCC43245.1 hypothetical protein E0H50_01820 [Kribbella sindirgiensis]